MKFAGMCVAGTEKVIQRQLKKLPIDEARITYIESGLICFEGSLTPQKVRELRYFTHTFVVMAESSQVSDITALATGFAQTKPTIPKELLRGTHTFRLRVINDGALTPLPAEVQHRVVETLRAVSGLVHAPGKGDIEFWLVRRASGLGFVGLELPRLRTRRQTRARGQLQSELANVLCVLAGVGSRDIVLDPFAGHGTIPLEAIAGFSPQKVIAADEDVALSASLRALATDKPSLQVLQADALALTGVPDASVTRIVTDPPWGEFATPSQPLETFYGHMLAEFMRVLHPGGVAVVLCGAPDVLRAALAKNPFEQISEYPILVSGKKATIFKLRRPS